MFKERLERQQQDLSALHRNEIFVRAPAHTPFNAQTWGANSCLSTYLSFFLSVYLVQIPLAAAGADQRWLYENVLGSSDRVSGD